MGRGTDNETTTSALSLAGSSEGAEFTTAGEAKSSTGSPVMTAMSAVKQGKQKEQEPTKEGEPQVWIPAKSWVHFVAGGLGGMCGAITTAPFDLAKTRLQSDLYSSSTSSASTSTSKSSALLRPALEAARESATKSARRSGGPIAGTKRLLYHFVETGVLLRDIGKNEGILALFKGLGPTLVGVIPARSINFFAYGNGKQIYARLLNNGQESTYVHLISAATAGIITATATNPIWVVKTRLQLQDSSSKSSSASKAATAGSRATFSSSAIQPRLAAAAASHAPSPLFTPSFQRSNATLASSLKSTSSGSMACIAQIWRNEGLKGFYRGLSASYLGVAEGTIQWTLYERFKKIRKQRSARNAYSQAGGQGGEGWSDKILSAGSAKFIATIITYPHEVVRTRLRQAPTPAPGAIQLDPTVSKSKEWAGVVARQAARNKPKYHGLLQTFKLVFKEEGFQALYSGLSPHLLRVVPNAVVMYSIYEMVLKYGNVSN